MSVSMSLLAILDEHPAYGLQLKNEFESRTASIWPLNVGQVYTTLARLERDGFVAATADDGDKTYAITPAGRERLQHWFAAPAESARNRDETVLKLVMAVTRSDGDARSVIQAQRKATIKQMQEYTRLKRHADEQGDLGWLVLLDSLLFQAEARARWLDACEQRLRRGARAKPLPKGTESDATIQEVRR